MEENIVSLISQLSLCFLGTSNVKKSIKEKKKHKSDMIKVSRVAYDVIRSYDTKEETFVVGGLEWYPDIWISDYGYELMHNGYTRGSEILISSLNQINEKNYHSINEIWKFLLQLKGPFDKKNVEQHPFSLSGQDYFFRFQNPYQLLPNDLIGSQTNKEETNSLIIGSLEDNVFLDMFVESPKASVPPQSTLSLNDFLDDESVQLSFNNNNTKLVTYDDKTLKPTHVQSPMAKSSSSDFEKYSLDNVLESSERRAGSFLKSYEDSLTYYQNDAFTLKNRHINETTSNVVLGIYLEDTVLEKLIDPTHKFAQLEEISLKQYVSQVKYLLCGINSNIFIYDDTAKKFYMKVGVYVDKLSPSTLFQISQNHLRTGSYFKKLTELVVYHLKDNCGILYSVFWNSVQDYLQKHCDAVTLISENCTLMGIQLVTADLQTAMAAVYKLCLENKNATTGGLLLNYLLTSCHAVQQECVRKVIMSFFYDCCEVYLTKHLEKWAFQGCLLSQWRADMFVSVNPELSSRRDRTCYSSITIEETQVPKFLITLVPKIFSCGKAIWLLKLFDPENKFIHYLDAMKHPRMKICMNENDLKILEYNCLKYQDDIIQLCGPEISFRDLIKKEVEDEDQISKSKDIKIIRNGYLSTKTKDAQEKAEIKKKLYKEQMEAAMEEKERKLKVKWEEKKREALFNEKLFIEEEKKKIGNKYQSLTDTVENFMNIKEWQNKRFELNEKRIKFLQEDYINKNTTLDKEGNVISEKSNSSQFCDAVDGRTNKPETLSDAEKIKQRNLKSQFTLSLSPTKMIVDDSPSEEAHKLTSPSTLKDLVVASLSLKNDKNLNLGNNMENIKMDIMNKNETADAFSHKTRLEELDVINSNQESDPHNTEAMRNKLKVLGTEYSFAMGTEANKQPRLTYQDDSLLKNEETIVESTDALKDKPKVSGTKYKLNEKKQASCENSLASTDLKEALINKLNVVETKCNQSIKNKTETEQLTLPEATKNKIKALSSEFDMAISGSLKNNKDVSPKRSISSGAVIESLHPSNKDLIEMSEAQRNKLKVLATEFGLPPETHEHKRQVSGPYQKNKLKGMGSDIVFLAERETPPKSEKDNNREKEGTIAEMTEISTAKPKRVSLNNPTLSNESELLSKIVNYSKPVDSFDSNIDILTFTRNLQRSIEIVIKTQEKLANIFILKHFLTKENLLSHITSIRCYFLLYDGAFSRNLSYGMFQALIQSSEPHHFFDRSLLSNILNEALTYTSIDAQVNANYLSFQILKMPKHLNVEAHDLFSPFQLAYKVNWPLNIIITDPSFDRYRKVFHLLMNLKRVHWTLNEAFLLLKAQTKDSTLDGIRLMKSPEYTKLATYRYAMTLFVITIEEHISGYGLQVAWIDFMKNLENVSNLDELYQKHVAFVKDLCRRCFLVKASQDLLSYIHELIELGLKFHYILKSGKWHLINETHYSHPKFTALKIVFNQFCKTTKIFNKTLRKKTSYPEMKIHLPLLELINLKIVV